MESRAASPAPWLRALFAGSFACFLGVAGHLMADGLLPGVGVLVLVHVVVVVLSVPVLSRPASRLRLVGLLVGGQTVVHLCLTLTAGHAGDPRVAVPTPRPTGRTDLPVVDGRRVGSFQDAFSGTDAVPGTTPTLPVHHLVADLSAHAPMMLAHVCAAAVLALWLAHGERCLLTVAAVTARLLLTLVRPVLPVAVPVALGSSLTEAAVVGCRDVLLCRSVSRRGPPLLAG